MIVVDCSVVVDVLTLPPDSESLASLLNGHSLHAPALLDYEFLSVLRKLTLTGRISPARAQDALIDLHELPIRRWAFSPEFQVRAFALRQNLSAYDAAYICLAESLGCQLLTRDARLARSPGPDAEIIVG
ncbi:MAG: type II toxin-antitoxin system VapC family toxin [Angustibacter sp.]